MMVQLELWQLITLLITFFGCIAAFGKLLLAQFEKRLDTRFLAQDQARAEGANTLREQIERYASTAAETANTVRQLERDLVAIKVEMPRAYVMREDYIRGQSVIEAKLDALYSKLEVVQMKGLNNG